MNEEREKNPSNLLPVLFLLTLVLGLSLLGLNVTGKAVYGSNSKSLCMADNECLSSEVCCTFYNNDAGICHTPEYCPAIAKITYEEQGLESALQRIEKETPGQKNTIPAKAVIALGIIFILYLILKAYQIRKFHKDYIKSLKKEKKKRK